MDALNALTPLGLTGLVIVLGYYAFTKLLDRMSEHLARQNALLQEQTILLTKMAHELESIQESFSSAVNNA